MKCIMILNAVCLGWIGVCFAYNLDPWTQVAILAPNMIAWTAVTVRL